MSLIGTGRTIEQTEGQIAPEALIDAVDILERKILPLAFRATASTTHVRQFVMPQDCVLEAVRLVCPAGGPPAGGTYTLAVARRVSGAAAGVNLLAAANFDCTALVGNTVSSIGLTATTQNLQFREGEILEVTAAAGAGVAAGTEDVSCTIEMVDGLL